MLHIIQSVVENKEITIVYEDGRDACHMTIHVLAPFDMVTTDDTYPNLRKLSADLRCDIGLGPARDLLHDHGVPQASGLWFLNHDGWAPDMRGLSSELSSRPLWLADDEIPAPGPAR